MFQLFKCVQGSKILLLEALSKEIEEPSHLT